MHAPEGPGGIARIPGRRTGVLAALSTLVLVALVLLAAPAAAQTDDDLVFDATIGGTPLSEVDGNDPLELASEKLEVVLDVENTTDDTITITEVSFRGEALGLEFFAYDVLVDIELDGGESDTRSFVVDLNDLREQATGLMPAEFLLLDEEENVLAKDEFTVDVDGDARSVYGTFGLLVMAATGLLIVGSLIRLFTNRLPTNRWRRAGYFAVPGFGVGMSLTFGLSVLSILSPDPGIWYSLIVGGTVIGFLVGYLTPSPYDETDDRDEFDDLLEMKEPAASGS